MNEVKITAVEVLALDLTVCQKRALLAERAIALGAQVVTSILQDAPYARDSDVIQQFIAACDEYRIASDPEATTCHCVGRQLRKTGPLR